MTAQAPRTCARCGAPTSGAYVEQIFELIAMDGFYTRCRSSRTVWSSRPSPSFAAALPSAW